MKTEFESSQVIFMVHQDSRRDVISPGLWHKHITWAVEAMDSCFGLLDLINLAKPMPKRVLF